MSRFGFGVLFAGGLLSLATAAPAAAIQGAQDGWAAITACSATPNDEARRDCMDGVLRRAGLMSGGLAVPGPAPAERPRFLGVPLPASQEDASRVATLERTRIDGEGRLELRTTDGELWRSDDTGLQLPKSGQAMTIKPTGFGGEECRVSRWESFLCRQDKMRSR